MRLSAGIWRANPAGTYLAAGFLAVFVGCVAARSAAAEVRSVEAGGDNLSEQIALAEAGDVLRLAPGLHKGPVTVDRSITLAGEPGAIVDGGGIGNVITVSAPDVVVTGLVVRNSGDDLSEQNSGIFVDKAGDRALIKGNKLEGNLIGIYLWGPEKAVARKNEINGRTDLHVNDRGNGVQLWNTPGSVVEGNKIRFGRDGIFVTTSRQNYFRDNTFRDLRFAIHYMYTNDSEVSGNVSIGNHVGYAIMFSHRLTVLDNLSDGDRDRGLLLNYANSSRIEDNVVRGGVKKCLFIYNAHKNRILGNRFQGCDIGIHFTAGSEDNNISGNAFIDNRTQVKYVGTRYIEWSDDGRGNYWSDNPAFDLNGDGIADRPYRPNDLVDQVVWRHPQAKLLLNSPAVQVLRWAQSEFPSLHPGGVTDSAPLLSPDGIGVREAH